MSREVPKPYLDIRIVWNRLASTLQLVYVLLGLTATGASLVVSSFTTELPTGWIKALSFSSAVALALITAFNIGGKTNAARTAWRTLNAAVLAYGEDSTFTIQQLHGAYVTGEDQLGGITYSSPEKPAVPKKEG